MFSATISAPRREADRRDPPLNLPPYEIPDVQTETHRDARYEKLFAPGGQSGSNQSTPFPAFTWAAVSDTINMGPIEYPDGPLRCGTALSGAQADTAVCPRPVLAYTFDQNSGGGIAVLGISINGGSLTASAINTQINNPESVMFNITTTTSPASPGVGYVQWGDNSMWMAFSTLWGG